MILPYGTDAPIYHRPIATIGLIAVNTLLWLPSHALVEGGYALDLGVGLHPVQWVTNNFLHGGLLHLVGNMLFLWAYGIIVEGKLGSLRFLLAYLAIGTAYGAFVQAIFLGATPIDDEPRHVLGASAAIFGLLGMAVVWAPKNCLSCLVVFMGFGRGFGDLWEIPILWFAALEVGWEVAMLVLWGGTGLEILSSALLHVCGFSMGFALGVLLLKAGWVDCEGWDLFAVSRRHLARGSVGPAIPKTRAGKKRRTKTARRGRDRSADNAPPEEQASSAVERLRQRLDEGETLAALDLYLRSAPTWKSWGWGLPEPDLLRLIKSAQADGLGAEAVPPMFEYVRRYPEKAARVRLLLAQLLIETQQRPAKALRVLGDIADGALPAELDRVRRKLAAKAEAMVEDGVLELETDE